MKIILFQDFKKGRHLDLNVDQFLAKQEEAQELADDDPDDSEATADKA